MMNVSEPLDNLLVESRLINQAEEGRRLTSPALGTLSGLIQMSEKKSGKFYKNLTLKNVMVVPSLCMNIISVAKLCEHGYKVDFKKNICMVLNNRAEVVMTATKRGGLYAIEVLVPVKVRVLTTSVDDSELWHQRLGHLNMQMVRKMIPGLTAKEKLVCKSCLQGKMARIAFSQSNSRFEEIFGLIHSDVCGPFEENAIGQYRYFVTFIDDKSRYTYVYLLRSKGEVFDKFKEFEVLVRTKYSKTIKILRSDNGGEYLSNEFDAFLKARGIEKQLSVPYTPQQNGVAERMNRTLVESARTMMLQANLKKRYWGYAVLHAAYLRNRCASRVLENKAAFEIVQGEKPDLGNLKVFGCVVYAHIPDEKRKSWM
jgi:hypothetical protein